LILTSKASLFKKKIPTTNQEKKRSEKKGKDDLRPPSVERGPNHDVEKKALSCPTDNAIKVRKIQVVNGSRNRGKWGRNGSKEISCSFNLSIAKGKRGA